MRRSREATPPGDFSKKNHTPQDFCIIAPRRQPAFHRADAKERIKTRVHKIRLAKSSSSGVKRLV